MAFNWNYHVYTDETGTEVENPAFGIDNQDIEMSMVRDIGANAHEIKGEPFLTNKFLARFSYIPYIQPKNPESSADAFISVQDDGTIVVPTSGLKWEKGVLQNATDIAGVATMCSLPEYKIETKGFKSFDIQYNYPVSFNTGGDIEMEFVDFINRYKEDGSSDYPFRGTFNLFYAWRQLIMNDLTQSRGYKAEYATTMTIDVLDAKNAVMMQWEAQNVFVKEISEIEMAYATKDIVRLKVKLSCDRVLLNKMLVQQIDPLAAGLADGGDVLEIIEMSPTVTL